MTQLDVFEATPNRPHLVVLDTNVLLLWLTGLADLDSISTFGRTRKFTREDFALLERVLDQFRGIVTTPNILTETTNLAGQAPDPLRESILTILDRLLSGMPEEYIASAEVSGRAAFTRLGLTDVAISELASTHEPELLVLTDDLDLYRYVTNQGTDAVNFTHLMAANLE